MLANVGPEQVESLFDVFGLRLALGIVCNLQGTTIVLENSAVNLCSGGVDGAPKLLHFFWQPDNRKGVLKGFGHAHIFCFSCGQGND